MTPQNNLTFMLHKLGAIMEHMSNQALFNEFGLGFSQFKILMALQYHQGAQQKNIAQFLGQTEASISRQIKLLSEAGFVQAKEDPENRKKHIITATKRGTQMYHDSVNILQELYKPVLNATMSANDQQVVLSKLVPVLTAVQEQCKR